MRQKNIKNVSLDTMIRLCLQKYNIPTRKDIDRLATRLDRLEKLVKRVGQRTESPKRVGRRRKGELSASDATLKIIKESKKGLNFSDIKDRSGFDDKKVRNIIYRLHKLKKIKRKTRGIYVAT